MDLKLITIDFWNTIFDSSQGIERNNFRRESMLAAAKQLSIEIDNNDFDMAVKESWDYFNRIWIEEFRTPDAYELVKFIWKKFNIPEDDDLINKVVKDFAETVYWYPPALMSGIREALDILEKKYTLCIVSDTGLSPGTVLRSMLNTESILHYFQAFSFSDETGTSKPHPKAFLTVLDKFNCSPEQALHIGDIEYTDIKGAKSLGMKAIKFTGDETSFLSMRHKDETAADFTAGSWSEILKIIDNLQ